jgi:hypothetical protein
MEVDNGMVEVVSEAVAPAAPPETKIAPVALAEKSVPEIKMMEQPQMECALPPFEVVNTPSRQDGVSEEDETDLRIIGCSIIHYCGIFMKQPEVFHFRLSLTKGCDGLCSNFVSPILFSTVIFKEGS